MILVGSKRDDRERRRRELRRRLLLSFAEPARCIDCRTELEPDYRCCPGCGTQLLRDCPGCSRAIHVAWSACAHCGEGAQPQLVPVRASAGGA